MSATNFPDHALAEYIKVLSDPKISANAESLRQNLAAPLKPVPTSAASSSTSTDDRTVLHRTMIVTVAKDSLKFNPADRIEATDVLIAPKDGVQFTSWDTAATLYTTINAGTIQLTQTRNTGQSLTAGEPPGGPFTGSLGLTANQGQTRVENFNGTSQVDNLTVMVSGGNMEIRRQGGVGIDLTGNTIIKVDLTVPSAKNSFKPVFSVSGDYQDTNQKWVTPDKLKLQATTYYVPSNSVKDITADVTLTYTMRHIVSGDETVEEKDDTVQELTKDNPAVTVVLVPERQVSPQLFGLYSGNSQTADPVFVSRPESSSAPLCFSSYQAAGDLLAYIQNGNRTTPYKLGDATLGFSKSLPIHITPLKEQDVGNLTVQPKCL